MTEIRFTKDCKGRTIAHRWAKGSCRWIRIGADKATALIALGQAVELKEGEWI